MSSQKPLIIPWLKSQIGNPEYPGLSWVNTEHTQFRIPWKHGLRHDRLDEDFGIFQGWAVASGTYRPGIDEPKPSVWKRNLRSALNRKPEIQVIEDHSSDSSNPHKVYEIINSSRSASQDTNDESQETDDVTSPSIDSPWLEMSDPTDPSNLLNMRRALEELKPWSSPLPQQVESNRPFPVQDQWPQEASPMEQFFPNNTLVTDFEVIVFYRGIEVQRKIVQNPRGMLFTSSDEPGHREDLERIVLPDPSEWVKDIMVANMIKKVLKNLVPGLLLEVQGPTICGMRRGKCKGFWTMTENPVEEEPKEVLKEEYTPLYTTQQFVTELIEFMERKRVESPLYSIWLCLGQHWPEPSRKPWNKMFIMVQVTPTVFKQLHEMSYAYGATSLRSSDINLQISVSLTSDNLLSFLQEWDEKMETEF